MKTQNPKSRKLFCLLTGALCGFLNGFFGAGGGTVAVPMIRKSGLGASLLKKIAGKWLRRIFGAFIMFTSVRMFLR